MKKFFSTLFFVVICIVFVVTTLCITAYTETSDPTLSNTIPLSQEELKELAILKIVWIISLTSIVFSAKLRLLNSNVK